VERPATYVALCTHARTETRVRSCSPCITSPLHTSYPVWFENCTLSCVWQVWSSGGEKRVLRGSIDWVKGAHAPVDGIHIQPQQLQGEDGAPVADVPARFIERDGDDARLTSGIDFLQTLKSYRRTRLRPRALSNTRAHYPQHAHTTYSTHTRGRHGTGSTARAPAASASSRPSSLCACAGVDGLKRAFQWMIISIGWLFAALASVTTSVTRC